MQKDISEKQLESLNDVFADIFNNLLFHGRKILLEDNLVALPTEAFTKNVDGSLRQGFRDIRKADKNLGIFRIIYQVENQEAVDNTMPERVMGYEYASYEEQIKSFMSQNSLTGNPAYAKRIHSSQLLAPVVTLVLYWGQEKWSSPLRLYDMLHFPPDIRDSLLPYVADYPMNLIQVSHLTEEQLGRLTSDFGLLAEFAVSRRQPDKLRKLMHDNQRIIRHPEVFLNALSTVAGTSRYREMQGHIAEHLSGQKEKEGITMWSIEEELENKGFVRGRTEGKTEDILLLLEELGPVPSHTAGRIRQERDPETLKRWLKTASRAHSMKEFIQNM